MRCASFQRREYSEIEIVQTEKKGFGLRAATDLRKYVRRLHPLILYLILPLTPSRLPPLFAVCA